MSSLETLFCVAICTYIIVPFVLILAIAYLVWDTWWR